MEFTRKQTIFYSAVCLGVLLVTVVLFGGFFRWVHFDSEIVQLTIDGNMLHVLGEYHYKNSWPIPVSQGISCPVGLCERDKLCSLALWTIDPETGGRCYLSMLPVSDGGKLITLRFSAGEELVLYVEYRVRLGANRAKYLLKTTRSWGEPLTRADFFLNLNGSSLADSSYELAPLKTGQYHFCREDFFPEVDWEFSWEKDSKLSSW